MNESPLPQLSYHDLRALNDVRELSLRDKNAALKVAAQQFEATFMQMLMKTMRESNEVFEAEGMFDSGTVDFYQAMHDEQLASSMASKGTLGLADLLVKQLSGATPTEKVATDRMPIRREFMEPLSKNAPVQSMPVLPRENNVVVPEAFSVSHAVPNIRHPQDFVSAVKPYAEKAAKELGISSRLLIAQAALETGWGKALPHNGNNCFGIKADQRWDGAQVQRKTLEVEAGVARQIRANFRCYDSLEASFKDYVAFVKADSRYSAAVTAKNDQGYITALSNAGYATDPAYVNKINSLMQRIGDLVSSTGG